MLQQSSQPKRVKAAVVLFALIIIVSFMVLSLRNSFQRTGEVNDEITTLERQIQNLERDNLEFRELIEYFNSDAYIEERARLDLGLKKEGENVVVVTDQGPTNVSVTQVDAVETGELENPQRWWRYFFN